MDALSASMRTASTALLTDVDVPKLLAVSTWDPRHMNSKEASLAIAAVALGWMLLEVLMHLTARRWLLRCVCPGGPPQHGKARLDASRTVTSAVSKLVSLVHNAIQIPVAMLVLSDAALQSDPIYATSRMSSLMCLISSGYFTYDLVIVLARFSQEGPAFLIHACCCLFVYGHAVYCHYLHFFGAGFLLWELSTPLVHARWFMLKAGQSRSTAYTVNGIALVLVFFACRPVWGTWLSLRFFAATEAELRAPRPGGFPAWGIWGYRVANVSLNLLNYVWFAKIAAKAVEALAPPKKAKARSGKIA